MRPLAELAIGDTGGLAGRLPTRSPRIRIWPLPSPSTIARRSRRPPNFRRERKLFRDGFCASPAWTRPAAGRSPGRSSRRPSCSNPKKIPKGIANSKVLTAEAREEIFAELCETAEISFAFGSVDGDRPHQHPAGDARRHAPRRARARRAGRRGARRRQRRPAEDAAARRGRSSTATRSASRSPPPRSSPR